MTTATKKAAPKQPQDRKPKAEAKPGTMTVDLRGLDVTVPVEALDDFELLDDLARVDGGDATAFPRLLRRLVGDQYDDALNLIRDDDTGRVKIQDGASLVYELLERLDPNSSGSRSS